MPKRVQWRARSRGWRKPDGVIFVGRPSRWGNPYKVEVYGREEAVDLFERDMTPERRAAARCELAGHDLACWCRLDQACHADVLLKIANSEASS